MKRYGEFMKKSRFEKREFKLDCNGVGDVHWIIGISTYPFPLKALLDK